MNTSESASDLMWVNECERWPEEERELYLLLTDRDLRIEYGKGKMSSRGWVLQQHPPGYTRVVAWLGAHGRELSRDDLMNIPKDRIRMAS
jgi:hypothetical protein